jgi:hypothetical protein
MVRKVKIGENLEGEVNEDTNKLTIVVDLNEKGTMSASGKSRLVANSHGFQSVQGTDVKINITVIR